MSTAVASHAHPPTSTGLDHRKIAIWAFIGSECMLFASLISTYLIYKGRNVVGPFPHEACNPPICATPLKAILNIPVTSASTFVLLMSSLTMVLALGLTFYQRQAASDCVLKELPDLRIVHERRNAHQKTPRS